MIDDELNRPTFQSPWSSNASDSLLQGLRCGVVCRKDYEMEMVKKNTFTITYLCIRHYQFRVLHLFQTILSNRTDCGLVRVRCTTDHVQTPVF